MKKLFENRSKLKTILFLFAATLSPLIVVWATQIYRGDLLYVFEKARYSPGIGFEVVLSLLHAGPALIYLLLSILGLMIFTDKEWLIGYAILAFVLTMYGAWWIFKLYVFLAPGDSIKSYFR